MYLGPTEKLQLVLAGNITTTALKFNVSYYDVGVKGVKYPFFNGYGSSTNTTDADIVDVSNLRETRIIQSFTLYNTDSVASLATIKKDVAGTDYIIIKALLQSGDTLQYNEGSGWSIIKSSLQESVLFTSFIATGSWAKAAGLKRILTTCKGAGGGSGSGRQGIAGENRFGGGGGGGGAIVWRQIAAEDLPSTVTVTIGAGGIAGSAPSGTSSNGNAGGAGGDTSFGGFVIAKGGLGGGGGSTVAGTAGAGGAVASCTPNYGPFAIPGSAGAAGATTVTAAGGNGLNGLTGGPGGGGGGGINSANTSGVAANTGGNVYQNGVLIAGPVSGASPNGANNKSLFLSFSSTLNAGIGLGTGGAGGNPAFPHGGNGGLYGAGAGGSAGTLNGAALTPGAVGGGGACIVMEFY
jgi:hypothetical protein